MGAFLQQVGDGEVCLRVDTASPEDRSTAVAGLSLLPISVNAMPCPIIL
jgi:hypothetical protein